MNQLVTFLTAMWLSTAAAQFAAIGSFAQTLTNDVAREVSAIKDPIIEATVGIASSQCQLVKNVFGVAYKSYDGDEPDLSKLNLNFITKEIKVSYILGTAAKYIPNSRWFDNDAPLMIYFHGFTDDPSKGSYTDISSAFLAHGDYNIMALDASSLIRWLYLRSSTMIRFIGEEVGKLLAELYKKGKVIPSNIHLIGHSLGSHIASFAGKSFFKLTGQRVGRITGLDPAGPCFTNVDETLRLHIDDADFVDAIHTDAGVFGLDAQVGHADFYPNSGYEQPGCTFQTCSHSRAWEYFTESVITTEAFIGTSCPSWKDYTKKHCDFNDTSVMGFACPTTTRGKYYLETNNKTPFGRGENGAAYLGDNIAILRKIFLKLG